jgi:hypothetical protein
MNSKLNYRFNKERHLHQIEVDGEWKNLTGCTTILGVLAKPALIPWAARMATDYIKEHAEWEGLEPGYYKVSEEILEEARKAHAKRKTEAGDYGTKTHEIIAEIIADVIGNSEGRVLSGRNSNKSVQNFIDWAIEKKVKFLETEKNIFSEEKFIGGIVDFVCEIDGQIWIGDIKTAGSGIYPEHFFQCAGYQIMLNDMGLYPDITGYLILNLKENGEMLEKRSISNEANKKIFVNCLEIYRQQEILKSNIN